MESHPHLYNYGSKELNTLDYKVEKYLPDNQQKDIITANASYYGYSNQSGKPCEKLVKIDLSTCQVTRINIAMAGYEFYTIPSSLAESDLTFSGLRYADGTISVSEETSSSSKIMDLIRLN